MILLIKKLNGTIEVSLDEESKKNINNVQSLSEIIDSNPDESNPSKLLLFGGIYIRTEIGEKVIPLEKGVFRTEIFFCPTQVFLEDFQKDPNKIYVFVPSETNKMTNMVGKAKIIANMWAVSCQEPLFKAVLNINERNNQLYNTKGHLLSALQSLSRTYKQDEIIQANLKDIIEKLDEESEINSQKANIIKIISQGNYYIDSEVRNEYSTFKQSLK